MDGAKKHTALKETSHDLDSEVNFKRRRKICLYFLRHQVLDLAIKGCSFSDQRTELSLYKSMPVITEYDKIQKANMQIEIE